MKTEDMVFPVYRKYKNGRNYFKIINAALFEEVIMIGERASIREVRAIQFPEKIFIKDLLTNYSEMAVEISEAEYNSVRKMAR